MDSPFAPFPFVGPAHVLGTLAAIFVGFAVLGVLCTGAALAAHLW